MSRRALVGLAALALASCATLPPPGPSPAPLQAHSLGQLPGWDTEDHIAALGLVRADCRAAPWGPGSTACRKALALGPVGDAEARTFLEANFRVQPVEGQGLLTAYFSPTYEARERPEGEFSAPVRPSPIAVNDTADRAALDGLPAPDALAWMRPEDLFFLQVQGSGSLTFPDGRRAWAVFAGANGRPFVAIAGPMVAEGLIAARDASSSGVHAWLAAHRGPEAQAVMRLDPRYVFFRLEPDDGAGPRGADGAPLVAGRSLAVDPAYHPPFELLWIDARSPTLNGARPLYRRLTAALDVGAAIKGPARADLYLGRGPAAGAEAGTVRHALRLWRVLPIQADAR